MPETTSILTVNFIFRMSKKWFASKTSPKLKWKKDENEKNKFNPIAVCFARLRRNEYDLKPSKIKCFYRGTFYLSLFGWAFYFFSFSGRMHSPPDDGQQCDQHEMARCVVCFSGKRNRMRGLCVCRIEWRCISNYSTMQVLYIRIRVADRLHNQPYTAAHRHDHHHWWSPHIPTKVVNHSRANTHLNCALQRLIAEQYHRLFDSHSIRWPNKIYVLFLFFTNFFQIIFFRSTHFGGKKSNFLISQSPSRLQIITHKAVIRSEKILNFPFDYVNNTRAGSHWGKSSIKSSIAVDLIILECRSRSLSSPFVAFNSNRLK